MRKSEIDVSHEPYCRFSDLRCSPRRLAWKSLSRGFCLFLAEEVGAAWEGVSRVTKQNCQIYLCRLTLILRFFNDVLHFFDNIHWFFFFTSPAWFASVEPRHMHDTR